jgi:small subunit ribosomal protein S16
MGRSNRAYFRLNAIDSRAPRDGRVIEELGSYDPRAKDAAKQFVAKLDRCKHWLDVGAVPSETVSSLLKRSGLEHKQLRLPKPGKPKLVAAEGKASAAEGKASAAEGKASAAEGKASVAEPAKKEAKKETAAPAAAEAPAAEAPKAEAK